MFHYFLRGLWLHGDTRRGQGKEVPRQLVVGWPLTLESGIATFGDSSFTQGRHILEAVFNRVFLDPSAIYLCGFHNGPAMARSLKYPTTQLPRTNLGERYSMED